MGLLKLFHITTCLIEVIIDPDNTYADIVNKFGKTPPELLSIPIRAFYKQYSFLSNITFLSEMEYIYYRPKTVVITKTLNPLKDSIDKCPLTTSVLGTIAADATTTGWKTGWRSVAWYESGSTFVTIPFRGVKDIYEISLNQLDNSSYTQFSAFKVSYSLDGISYIELPEVEIKINKSFLSANASKFLEKIYLKP